MTWVLDEQRRMLRDSAQDFFASRMPVSHLRALRDANDPRGYDRGSWRALGQQGYSAILVPEAHGGLALGVCEAGLVAEQIGHTLAPSPFLSTSVLAAWLLADGGNAEQQAAWLPAIARADAVLALAVDESPRHRPEAIETRARRDRNEAGDGWRIDGEKTFVVDGHGADALIVAARAEEGVALLIVPAGTAGVSIERTAMVDAHNAARVRFDGVRVPASARLGGADGQRNGGRDDERDGVLLAGVLDVGRAVVAAELLGLADEVFERTVDYIKQRKQFDRVIGEFQALQHRAAELFCDLELTRAIVRQALQALDDDAPDAALRVAQAKARAGITANRAVQEGVQMHGGIGMTDELEIGFFMKRARVLNELFGDPYFQMDRAALMTGY